MNARIWPRTLMVLLLLAGWAGLAGAVAAKELKLEAQLVWGTNQDKAPEADQKPVTPEVEKRLKALPFKWQHYYQIKKRQFTVAHAGTQRITMSKDCTIIVKNLENDQVEVTLLGKGEAAGSVKQKLTPEETLVLGGNAANFTGWFVVIRQVK